MTILSGKVADSVSGIRRVMHARPKVIFGAAEYGQPKVYEAGFITRG